MICATLVNTQTHTDNATWCTTGEMKAGDIISAVPCALKSAASWTDNHTFFFKRLLKAFLFQVASNYECLISDCRRTFVLIAVHCFMSYSIFLCCCRLAEMHISAAGDIVSRYMTLQLLLNILFVAMFGMLSLLMLFLLCVVYLSCFMSCTDTLLSAFSHVMNSCMLFVTCPLLRCVHCFSFFKFFSYVPCVRFQ